MTGENFRRFSGSANSDIKKLKNEIQKVKDECSKLENVNIIKEYGFDSVKHNKLTQQIERLEYELYGLEYEDNRRRNWK